MAIYELSFGLDNVPDKKVAKFSSIEEKQDYVDAEFKDKKCQDAYFAYQGATTKKERQHLGQELAVIRYAFYKKYALDNLQDAQFKSVNIDFKLNTDPDLLA